MQMSLLTSYMASLLADPGALVMSAAILYTGYLLFGLEPTPDEAASSARSDGRH